MAIYTALPTVSTGDPWTASDHNTYIKDNFTYVKDELDDHSNRMRSAPASALTISSGSVTVFGTAGQGTYQIEGEGGADDDLDTISGGASGDIIILTKGGETITLKDGTGNLDNGSAGDLVMSDAGHQVMYVYIGTSWVLLAHNIPSAGLDVNVETLSGTKTLVNSDMAIQQLDPDGTNRRVNLPAESSDNPVFYLVNSGNQGADLQIYDDGGEWIYSISNGEMLSIFPDLSAGWWMSIVRPVTYGPTGSYIYFAGGDTSISDVDRYSVDTWSSVTSMTVSIGDGDGVMLDGKGYTLKGTTNGAYTGGAGDAYEYSPDAWTTKSSSSIKQSKARGATPDNLKGYIEGGKDTAGTYSNWFQEYDPDTWTAKANGQSCYYPQVFAVDGYVYRYGGISTTEINTCSEWTEDTWTSRTDGNYKMRQGACFTLGTAAYVAYGYNTPSGTVAYVQKYDPDVWTIVTSGPSPARAMANASDLNGKGYVGFGTGSQDMDEYDPDTWTSRTSGPSPARNYPQPFTLGS